MQERQSRAQPDFCQWMTLSEVAARCPDREEVDRESATPLMLSLRRVNTGVQPNRLACKEIG